MGLRLNSIAPDFTTDSTTGKRSLHQWMGVHYAILFLHPKDFTPVCTTELGTVARLATESAKNGKLDIKLPYQRFAKALA